MYYYYEIIICENHFCLMQVLSSSPIKCLIFSYLVDSNKYLISFLLLLINGPYIPQRHPTHNYYKTNSSILKWSSQFTNFFHPHAFTKLNNFLKPAPVKYDTFIGDRWEYFTCEHQFHLFFVLFYTISLVLMY